MISQLMLIVAVALQPTGTETYTMRATPLSEQQIVAVWAQTCLASGLHDEQLERALEGTSFKEGSSTMDGLRRNWTSPNGSLAFIKYVPTDPPIPLPQCNLTLFASKTVDAEAFRHAMSAQLEHSVGAPAQHRVGRFGETWWWRDASSKPFKVSRIYMEEGSLQVELTLTPGEPQPEPATAATSERG